MMRKQGQRAGSGILILIVVFLCGLAGFSVYRYLNIKTDFSRNIRQLKELDVKNITITKELEQKTVQITALSEENNTLKQEISKNEANLSELQAELGQSRDELSGLKASINELTDENRFLKEQESVLKAKLEELSGEKAGLEAKISSVNELKRMIKDLIKQKKAQRRRQSLPKESSVSGVENIEGNRGYIIYQGQPTSKGKVFIKILPAN